LFIKRRPEAQEDFDQITAFEERAYPDSCFVGSLARGW
jgi:hypothetical protein